MFKIYPGDNTPIKSSFQLWSSYAAGPEQRIDMVADKLGAGAQLGSIMDYDHSNVSWFYTVGRDHALNHANSKHWLDDSPRGWIVQIYLTTEAQLTYCALAFDKWAVQ